MMDIAVTNTQQPQAQDFQGNALVDQFISFIDRTDKTSRTYIVNLRQFIAWTKYTGMERPTREDIIAYRQWLCAEHDAIEYAEEAAAGWTYRTDKAGHILRITCKPNTVKQYLQSVRQFFKWTASAGLYPNIADNIHAPKVRTDTHRKDALTAAEVLSIENSITEKAKQYSQAAAEACKDRAGRIQRSTEQGKRLYAMYLLTVNAGLRTIEISRANVKDIVTKGGQSWLYICGKGHTEPDQKKPIVPEVAEAINDYLKSRTDSPTGSSPLFVSTGNRSGGKRIAPTTISTMLKRAMQEAGYNSERITAHSLRHSTGTAVMELTNDLLTAQKYMRHSSPTTTEIYIHEGEREEAKAAALAKDLYDHYHGNNNQEDPQNKLKQIIACLNPAQLKQLADMAATVKTAETVKAQ